MSSDSTVIQPAQRYFRILKNDYAFYKPTRPPPLTLARKKTAPRKSPTGWPKSRDHDSADALPNVTYAVGGVSIKAGETTIGGIGVSGAPGGQFDEECARTALAKIKDRMK